SFVARLKSYPVVLIVVGGRESDWRRAAAVAGLHSQTTVAEVISRDSAREAAAAGFEALVIAGHEAGGNGSDDSSLILLQAVLAESGPPVWVRGGIGARSASACLAAGAAGVVLDGALLLARESPLSEGVRERIERWDGSETTVVGRGTGRPLRVHL